MLKRSMRIVLTILCLVLIFTLTTSSPQPLEAYSITSPDGGPALTDGFTYQGYLEQNGIPANGFYDFSISVWDAATLGTSLGTSQSLTGQYVDNGIFSFNIYLNAANQTVFNGDGRWIQVQVKDPADATWTTMARQPITAVPYAWSLRPGAKIEGSLNTVLFEVTNTDSSGTLGGAIKGTAASPTAPAVSGYHTGDAPGIYGYATGVYPAIDGIHGGNGIAVGGYTQAGYGVFGSASDEDGYGVAGFHSGVSAADNNYWESGGIFGGANGVIGMTKTNNGYGVFGYVPMTTANTAWAGYFRNENGNGVSILGGSSSIGLAVLGGTKNAVVPTDDGARLLYTEESTEVWFTDYGFGQLENGVALIGIDPIFAQTVNLDEPYHVFVEVYGDADVYVTDRTAESFRVVLRDGADDVEFSYRLVATRLGFEGHRLERSPEHDEIMDDPDFVSTNAQTAEQQ